MSSSGVRRAPAMIQYSSVLVLLLMLPLAMKSVILGLALVVLLLLVILVASLGLNKASTVCMVLAFGLAPMDKLGVAVLGISDVFFFLAIGLALPRLLRHRITLPPAYSLAAIAFVTIVLLSCVSAGDGQVYYYAARVIFTVVFLPIAVVWWAPNRVILVRMLVAFAVGTGISVLYGLPKIGAYRNYGLSQHPNVLGYTATLTMALVPFLFLSLTPKWRWWICGGALGSAGIGILTSGSRAALVVALFLIVLVPAVERSIPLALTVITSGAVVVAYVGERAAPAAGQGQDAVTRLLGGGDVSGSDQARKEGLSNTWHLALTHPWLGTGFELSEFLGHNVYVQVAASLGFIGVSIFIWLLFSMVTPLLVTSNLNSRLVYPALVYIVAGPVSPQLTDRYIGILMGVALIGVNSVRAQRQAEAELELSAEPPRLVRLNR
jgi:hypothetical protein